LATGELALPGSGYKPAIVFTPNIGAAWASAFDRDNYMRIMESAHKHAFG
jgi:hypothetical protein